MKALTVISNHFNPSPQVQREHYLTDYDDARRWSSYWLQIQLVRQYAGHRILEVGVGNGLVSTYLKMIADMHVTKVDIDLSLKPDVVADIAALPFENQSFDGVLACEVLEHIPYERVAAALREMRRVASHAIVSVPNANKYVLQLFVGFGSRRQRVFAMCLPSKFKRPKAYTGTIKQHYWELNRGDTTVSKFKEEIQASGWIIRRDFRNQDFPAHHFFVLDGGSNSSNDQCKQ